jgi:hypothetical protein
MGKLSPILNDEFAAKICKTGRNIQTQQRLLDQNKWLIAEMVNLEWRDEGYQAEGTNKREYYKECCRLLPVMVFGKSGETLRRWCETQAHYADEKDILTILSASSFDHLLRAKRLQANRKVTAAILAVAEAVKDGMSAEDMENHFDPEHEGSDSRHVMVERLFSLSEKSWIPKEAADHLLEAARIMREMLKNEALHSEVSK